MLKVIGLVLLLALFQSAVVIATWALWTWVGKALVRWSARQGLISNAQAEQRLEREETFSIWTRILIGLSFLVLGLVGYGRVLLVDMPIESYVPSMVYTIYFALFGLSVFIWGLKCRRARLDAQKDQKDKE